MVETLLTQEMNSIKNFTISEILSAGSCDYQLHDIPLALRNNIIPTIKVLQKLREYIDQPIFLLSTFRNNFHNKLVGGEENSLHLYFNAIDFTLKDKNSLHVIYNLLDYWDRARYFSFLPKSGSMGLGLYHMKFIHIDTRAVLLRHSPARWNG